MTRIERLRHRLARKLCPELFEQAERGWYLNGLVTDLRHWCSEFEDVAQAARWALATTSAAYPQPGQEPAPEACHVSEFRERLRKRRSDSRRESAP